MKGNKIRTYAKGCCKIEVFDLFLIIPDSRNDRTWNTDLKKKRRQILVSC